MQVHLPDGTERTLGGGGATVSGVLLSLGINPAAVIVSRDGRVIPEDTLLGSDDEIRVTRVSHGG
ncbi:MAG TPA: MoaD/ThiS family protein [Methanomicrobiales archaeon]|nr:MoaD/ThiS family protein [Methanomicrobiales archaeon]